MVSTTAAGDVLVALDGKRAAPAVAVRPDLVRRLPDAFEEKPEEEAEAPDLRVGARVELDGRGAFVARCHLDGTLDLRFEGGGARKAVEPVDVKPLEAGGGSWRLERGADVV